jgi:hypothetical protein
MPDASEGRKEPDRVGTPTILTPFSTGFQIIFGKGAAIAVFCLSNIKPEQVTALAGRFRMGLNEVTGFFYISLQSGSKPSPEDPQGSILIDNERALNVLSSWAETVLRQKEIIFIIVTDVDDGSKDIRTVVVPPEAIPVEWLASTLQPRLAELKKKLSKGSAKPQSR